MTEVVLAMVAPVLEYSTRPLAPEHLALEEGPDFVRVIFPVSPTWNYIAWICVLAAVGILDAIIPVIWTIHWEMVVRHRFGIHDFNGISIWSPFYMVLHWLGDISFWLVLASYFWWRYRRWGRAPRTLVATREGLTFSHLGIFGMRQRHWPADAITAVEIRPQWANLSRHLTLANLTILRGDRILRQFRLSTSDPQLPEIIANRIRSLLVRS